MIIRPLNPDPIQIRIRNTGFQVYSHDALNISIFSLNIDFTDYLKQLTVIITVQLKIVGNIA